MTAIIFQTAGLLVTAVGAGIWFLPAGFIVMGLGILAMGIAMERGN